MPETYSPIIWHNDQSPAINENNLNRIEVGIEALDDRAARLELGVADPVVIPFATSITIDATQGSLFRCTAIGDLTLDSIVGGIDGQTIELEVLASGGIRSFVITGGAEATTIAAGEQWAGKFRYRAVDASWVYYPAAGGGSGGGGSGGVSSVNGLTGAVALTADSIGDGSTKVQMTSAERSKLAGVAAGATIYGDEQAQDAAAALFTTATHTGVGAAYDDSSNRLSLTVTGGSATPTAHPTDPTLYSFGATIGTAPTAPGAPTITGVTAGSGQVTVSFTPPASNGGAAISGYTATSTPGGFTGSGSSSPIVVSGLANGTAYTFTVKATNSAGTGPASAASSSATPAASGAGGSSPGSSTPATWWIPFGSAPHCRVTWQTGVVSGQAQVVWVASMPDVRTRTTTLETGVAAQTQDAYQAYVQDLSTGATVADSGTVLGTASSWTATTLTPVAGRRYRGFARVRAADGQWSAYSSTRFVAPTGVTRFFEDFGMVGDGTTRSGTDYGSSIGDGPIRAGIRACNPGDVLKSNAPGTAITGVTVTGTAISAASGTFTGRTGQKIMSASRRSAGRCSGCGSPSHPDASGRPRSSNPAGSAPNHAQDRARPFGGRSSARRATGPDRCRLPCTRCGGECPVRRAPCYRYRSIAWTSPH